MRLTGDQIDRLREQLFDTNGMIRTDSTGRITADVEAARKYAPHVQLSGTGIPEKWGLPPAEHFEEFWMADSCLNRPWPCCLESWINFHS